LKRWYPLLGSPNHKGLPYDHDVPSSDEAARAAQNESIFRELNDHLEATSAGAPWVERGFVCECADMSCTEVIAVPLEEYQAVRSEAERFIVAPKTAHVDEKVERVVGRMDGYWVVEKLGVAGDVSEDLAPGE
jgi:hypothetical protein